MRIGNWDTQNALTNAYTRYYNTKNNGYSTAAGLGAFFTPNRTTAGNQFYNQNLVGAAYVDNRPDWQKQGYGSYDDYALNNGLPTSTNQVDTGLAYNSVNQQANGTPMYRTAPDESGTGGTGTGTGTGYSGGWAPVTFMGQVYDVNNPAGRNALQQAQMGYATGQYNTNKSALQRAMEQYNQNYNTVYGDNGTYAQQIGRQKEDWGKGLEQGNAQQNAYFASLGPIAQSAEMQMYNERKNAYNQNLTDLAQQEKLNRDQASQGLSNYQLSTNNQLGALDQALQSENDAIANNIQQYAQPTTSSSNSGITDRDIFNALYQLAGDTSIAGPAQTQGANLGFNSPLQQAIENNTAPMSQSQNNKTPLSQIAEWLKAKQQGALING